MIDSNLIKMVAGFVFGIILQFFIMDFNLNKLSFQDYCTIAVVASLVGYICLEVSGFLNKHYGVPYK